MSLRLRLVSAWMPGFMKAKEIEMIRRRTNEALDRLLEEHAPNVRFEDSGKLGISLEERRQRMALGHELRVQALIGAVGRDRAIALGREAMFRTGLDLGKEAKARLKVGDGREDLLRAAAVLYRVLGIDFVIISDPGGLRMEVTRCALSRHYTKDTCTVLSAIDEGTVSGLNPNAILHFDKHITDGLPRCIARIELPEAR